MLTKYFSWRIMVCSLAALILANCKVPYDPPLKSNKVNNLVVEGFIDGAAPTTIKLSRTRQISVGDTAALKFETNARVSIEDDQQLQYPLTESGSGNYVSQGILSLNPALKYRVHIFTTDGKEYLSDLVAFKQSPPIDDIGMKFKDGDAQIFVNTHDPNNDTKYYRWEYNETWEFHTTYGSYLKYDPDSNKVFPRTEQVRICWRDAGFTTIILGSSAKLSSDVISEMPLVLIPNHNQKLSVLYSILVKQYALDLDGYNYWQAMKGNTESVGSIFDPQPNQTTGNIHCTTNADEVVVGYVGAGSSFTKRVFIPNSAVPGDWNQIPFCDTYDVLNNPDSLKYYFLNGGLSPISEKALANRQTAYFSSRVDCVDCTLFGTNVKPSFWP
jgi:Domain of unknown function (DUF4249)